MYRQSRAISIISLFMMCAIIFSACSEKEAIKKDDKEELAYEFLDIEITEKYDYYYNEVSKNRFEYDYELPKLSEKDSEKFPELNRALKEFSKKLEKEKKKYFEETWKWAEEATLGESGVYSNLEHTEDIYIRRADAKVLSFMVSGYEYLGGAHGMPLCIGKNFDSVTGKEISLFDDVIKDKSEFADIVENQLYEKLDNILGDLDIEEYLADNKDNISWTLDYNGVTLVFGPYEIAPYAEGMPAATVLFEEHPEIFYEKYTETPAEYTVELHHPIDYGADVTGDGNLDTVRCSTTLSKYDFYKYEIDINGNSLVDDDVYAYDYRTVLVHKENSDYLFVESSAENDSKNIRIYDITNGDIKVEDDVNGSFFYTYDEKSITRKAITNPYELYMGRRTDLLSTVMVYRTYEISKNASLSPIEEISKTDSPVKLTLLQNIEVEIYDEKSHSGMGEENLKERSTLTFYAVDENDFAYLKTEDGRTVRVKVENDAWPRTVCGMDIYEVFEGMMFAG